jgi:hypothetical protein
VLHHRISHFPAVQQRLIVPSLDAESSCEKVSKVKQNVRFSTYLRFRSVWLPDCLQRTGTFACGRNQSKFCEESTQILTKLLILVLVEVPWSSAVSIAQAVDKKVETSGAIDC